MGAVARGLWLELRVIPVLLWSFSAITLGTALGGRSDVEGWYYLGAVALGVLALLGWVLSSPPADAAAGPVSDPVSGPAPG